MIHVMHVGMQMGNRDFVGFYFWSPMILDFEGELLDENWWKKIKLPDEKLT